MQELPRPHFADSTHAQYSSAHTWKMASEMEADVVLPRRVPITLTHVQYSEGEGQLGGRVLISDSASQWLVSSFTPNLLLISFSRAFIWC